MKVTNEQLEECLEYIKHINSLLNNHVETTGPTAFNLASDLLEARAQNAELLSVLKKTKDALEIGLSYVLSDGWTRHQESDAQAIRDALELLAAIEVEKPVKCGV